MSVNYRTGIESLSCTYEDIVNDERYQNRVFVELSDVISIIDCIERDVSDIQSILENIEGLTEIYDAKTKLSKLADNVYSLDQSEVTFVSPLSKDSKKRALNVILWLCK